MNQNIQKLALVMASDEKYVSHLRTAIKSIRKYNSQLNIHIFSCSDISSVLVNSGNCQLHQVVIPENFKHAFKTNSELEHSATRIAKLESMTINGSENIMYIDSDIVAFTDIERIVSELPIPNDNIPVVYLLLRRPQIISISDISWLYFKNSSEMTTQQMTDLVNTTFNTNYTEQKLLTLNCWNGGVVYGNAKGVHLLCDTWKRYYEKMLMGKNKDSFIPNDQLCLWLVTDQLANRMTIKELPLSWNFMPGHALEELMKKPNPSIKEIKESLNGVNILHLAQNKTDIWAQILINDINSN